jgi:thioredoxin-dependent peroxiredoxin
MNRISRLALAATLMVAAFGAIVSAADAPAAPAAGAAAPAFTLTNNEGQPTSLADYHGKWVVLYFYPRDFTSGCTVEAHNFQQDLARYEKAGAVILGVSVDSASSHKDFCAKEGLAFKLLSDPDGKVSAEYGSVGEYEGKKISTRNTFLIDPQGKVAKVFLGVKPAGHSAEVLTALSSLQKS